MMIDQKLPYEHKEDGQSQEWENQTTLNKGQRQNSQFQKNYPKNIFIPIIEYLAELGMQKEYETAVGTRQEFQGKNVVSLSLIYQLLTQSWFQTNVNKKLLEVSITNKILMNSKIKKKLFHLKVSRILLETKANDAKEFKKIVSRKANAVAQEIQENDELFQYSSSLIYLLNLFLSTLKNSLPSRINDLKNQSLDTPISNSGRNFNNSKEELKSLTKGIIITFGKIKASSSSLRELQDKIRDVIMQRALDFNKKYDLAKGAPNWQNFVKLIVQRCIRQKLEGKKMTNSLLNNWILEFKQKLNEVEQEEKRLQESDVEVKEFSPIILVSPPSFENFQI